MVLFRVLAVFTAVALAGCTAMTTIRTSEPDVAVSIREKSYSTTPIVETFETTSFGNFEFKAAKSGRDPFYGILPLKFNGGYLALDILFFAPAAFFNLREVFPIYEIDFEKSVVRYKTTEQDEWQDYRPTQAEAARAKTYFGLK